MSDLISRADALAECQKVADEAKSYGIPQMSLGAHTCRDAIRALPAYDVAVRELEWVDFDDRGAKAQAWNAANYLIQKWNDGRYEISASYPGHSTSIEGIDRFHPTIEAAKAAAQADYAALTATPTRKEVMPDDKDNSNPRPDTSPGVTAGADTATPAQDVAGLVKAAIAIEINNGDMPCKAHCGNLGGYGYCTCGMEAKRNALTAALARMKEATHV